MSEQVTRLFADQQPGLEQEDIDRSFVGVARAISQICATRMLLMISIITGCAIWSYSCFDPSHDRIYAAIAFSGVFVLPQILLYWKRG